MNAATKCLVIFLFLCPTAIGFGFQQSQEVGLDVLKHYLGVWDSEFSIESVPPDAGDTKSFKGVVKAKWVVDEKFMDQTGTYKIDKTSPPFIMKTMMSFDEENSRFQFEYFISTGERMSSIGEWNARRKIMTSTIKSEDNVVTIMADFSTKDVERWTIETRNDTGRLLGKIIGTNKRRKDK